MRSATKELKKLIQYIILIVISYKVFTCTKCRPIPIFGIIVVVKKFLVTINWSEIS